MPISARLAVIVDSFNRLDFCLGGTRFHFELAVERRHADPEHLGRFFAAVGVELDGLLDVAALLLADVFVQRLAEGSAGMLDLGSRGLADDLGRQVGRRG